MAKVHFIIVCSFFILDVVLAQNVIAEPGAEEKEAEAAKLPLQLPIIDDKIRAFTSAFVQHCQESEVMQNILSTNVKEIREETVLRQAIRDAAKVFKYTASKEQANMLIDSIISVKDILKPESMAQILGCSVAEVLLNNGLLTSSTRAAELGKSFGEFMEKEGDSIGQNPSPGESTKVLTVGMFNFLDNLHILSQQTSVLLVHYLTVEFSKAKMYS